VHGARTMRRRGSAWSGQTEASRGVARAWGKARGPRAARELGRRGIGRRTGANAKETGVWARTTSRRGAVWPTAFC
jgi:hypothetical protein